ncbi:MAG: EamA family transporter [Chlamydiae bacterium]|nr:EamA family transporter [Chlamydiota bacterium]
MPPLHTLLILAIVAVWSFNFVAIKIGLEGISPLLLCTLRFILTSIPAIFFVKKPNIPFKMIFLYGIVLFALQFTLLFSGIAEGIDPGLASLLLQVQVFFSALLAYLFYGEKPHKEKVIGGIIAFSGIVLVAINISANTTKLGLFLVLGAALSWSFGNVISKKIGKTDMIALVIWASLVAWPPLLVVSLFVDGPSQIYQDLTQMNLISLSSVLYITYMSTLFGYSAWSWLLQHHNMQTIAPFTLMVPIFAMMFSVLLLGEPLQTWKIIAASLVILGLCINLIAPSSKVKIPPE